MNRDEMINLAEKMTDIPFTFFGNEGGRASSSNLNNEELIVFSNEGRGRTNLSSDCPTYPYSK